MYTVRCTKPQKKKLFDFSLVVAVFFSVWQFAKVSNKTVSAPSNLQCYKMCVQTSEAITYVKISNICMKRNASHRALQRYFHKFIFIQNIWMNYRFCRRCIKCSHNVAGTCTYTDIHRHMLIHSQTIGL